jgi:hypothetical protein
MRDTSIILKERKRKKMTLLCFEPTAIGLNVVNSSSSLFEYTSSGGNALGWSYLK